MSERSLPLLSHLVRIRAGRLPGCCDLRGAAINSTHWEPSKIRKYEKDVVVQLGDL